MFLVNRLRASDIVVGWGSGFRLGQTLSARLKLGLLPDPLEECFEHRSTP
jgi:hypothetical protein